MSANRLVALLWTFALTLFLLIAIEDAITFHRLINKGADDIWYSTNWFKQPYTNLRLLGKPRTAAPGGHQECDTYFEIIDVQFDSEIVFWTRLEREPRTPEEQAATQAACN